MLIARIPCSFFAEAQRITAEDYVPSTADIGHTSETGVTATHFDVDKLSIRMLQVYGQQGHFKKWIHLFEGVTCLMFCASLADYDEPGASRTNQQVCALAYVFTQIISLTTVDYRLG